MSDQRDPKYPPTTWSIEPVWDFGYLDLPAPTYEDEDELDDGCDPPDEIDANNDLRDS